jgi:steroid delta-isomerase-like uncharacterized protein
MNEEMIAVYRRLVDDVWNRGDPAAVDEIFAPEFVGNDPAPPNLLRGPEGMKRFVAQMRAAFPDWTVTTDDVMVDGDKLVSRWTVCGTHRGPFAGVEPTGKQIEMHGMSIHRIVGGKIVENWHGVDKLGMLRQIGAVPSP